MVVHMKRVQRQRLTRVFNEYARKIGLLKDKDKNLEGTDIREGLATIVSVRIPEHLLQFEGQTKGKLGTSEARSAVDSVVSEQILYVLEENAELSASLVRKAIRARKCVKRLVKRVRMHEMARKQKG